MSIRVGPQKVAGKSRGALGPSRDARIVAANVARITTEIGVAVPALGIDRHDKGFDVYCL